MAIEKMKAVTISASIDEFDYVVEKYIYPSDIHLEKTVNVLSHRRNIQSFEESNDYEPIEREIASMMEIVDFDINPKVIAKKDTTISSMQSYVSKIKEFVEDDYAKIEALKAKKEENEESLIQLELIKDFDFELNKIFSMDFIRAKFGSMPKTGYLKLKTYLDSLETVFVKTAEDADNVWGFYFAPMTMRAKVEEVFASLYFNPIRIQYDYMGTPKDIIEHLKEDNAKYSKEIEELTELISTQLRKSRDKLSMIYNLAVKRSRFVKIKQNAAHTEMFFYVVGWMEEKAAAKLENDITHSGDNVLISCESPGSVREITPPTRLRNIGIFKPFEMFVKMYALPNYKELDPTPILALTYILFFGIMFGDVGQSLILSIVGFAAYKFKKMDLGGIIGMVGLAGIVSGFVYGSIFGNEEILPELLGYKALQPMHSIMPLLLTTVVMGGVVILFGLIINVINKFRLGEKGEAIFGHNGIAGVIFYLGIIFIVAKMMLRVNIPTPVIGIMFAVSLISMYMSAPLTKLINGKKDWFPKSGMYFVENFFEIFEVVLSFFTNTISFLRIGAFAVIHVGMMMAVHAMAGDGGASSVIVSIIGNIIVMVLEGLIVAIQVLRLQYYEMFSRYFTGGGKEFVGIKNNK